MERVGLGTDAAVSRPYILVFRLGGGRSAELPGFLWRPGETPDLLPHPEGFLQDARSPPPQHLPAAASP